MERLDLNLLLALDVLLAESSVLGAARRMHLSASAMSRTLTRLRAATGDPLLVRAGRGLVATPHALALRDRVDALVKEASAVLRPAGHDVDPASLDATFTIRAGRWFMESIGSSLVSATLAAAPQVRLRFLPKHDKDLRPLRDGTIDLEIGLVGELAPEVRTQFLVRDDLVGVARVGHPIFSMRKITAKRFASLQHVMASQWGDFTGPVDESLAKLDLYRIVAVVVPGFPDALRIARVTDLVTVAPRSMLEGPAPVEHETRAGLRAFALPVEVPEIRVSAMWHPRLDADPAHRWLRRAVSRCFKDTLSKSGRTALPPANHDVRRT
ncbi:MAG TPA: LysR family transcriptional regulator [Polyangiaceae bacterium]|nr:LysR family transcriptional regulator [Polyangiaceae bacterium]